MSAAVTAHDQGFVAAPPREVYEVLSDVRSYPAWWPGTDAAGDTDAAAGEGADTVRLRLPPAPPVIASAERHRPGVGVFIRLGPPLEGTLEWYLEPFEEGSIVNAILDLRLDGGRRRAARRLGRLRAGIRGALVALREHLA